MHIENLNEVPYFQNMIKAIKSGSVEGGGLAGNMARVGEKRNSFGALVGKSEGNKPAWKLCL